MSISKRLLSALVAALACTVSATALEVNNLRVQALRNPSAVDQDEPQFTWQLQSAQRNVVQTAYQLVITTDLAGSDIVFDSGWVESEQSVNVPAKGASLQPSTRYYWHVSVRDNKDNEATSSETAWFDTGLMTSGWSGAQWIKASNLMPGQDADEITDYSVEGKIRIEHTAAGLCFAMQNESNFYFWQLNTEGSYPRLRPHIWNNGSPACLDNVDLRGKAELNNTDEFALRIDVTNASHARTYINNVLVDERDGNFKYGRIGMREDHGETDGQPEIGVYDDIIVKKADGTVLFYEDFSKGNSFTAGTLTNEKLRITGSTTNHVLAWQKLSEDNYIHYSIDYDFYLVKASAALVFAATSSNTYHMWQINCNDNANPSVRHHTYINGTLNWNDSQFTQFTKNDILGHKRHVRIDVENGTISTYVDDILVDVFTDNTGTAVKGDIGMRVDNNTGEEAYFDNIVVTEYDTDGNSHVTLSEDFEGLSSDYFLNADIEEFEGSRMCHVKSPSSEKKIMQTSTNGVPVFRKSFTLDKQIASAKLYTSALGVYDLFVNGQRAGHLNPDGTTTYEELKPGWSDYRRRVFYSTHDVTSLLQTGQNAISSIVTSGWYSGGIAHNMYGNDENLSFIAKLIVTYTDGTQEVIVTDKSWLSSRKQGLRYSDIYNGEIYDARMESAWTEANYDTSGWNTVDINGYSGQVEAFKGPYVEKLPDVQSVRTATVYEGSTPEGNDYGMVNVIATQEGDGAVLLKKGQTVVFDFGQNIVGWTRFAVKGAAGTRMHLQYSEMLNDNGQRSRGNDGPGGSLYLLNLRSARAEVYYTLNGNEKGETWHPSTTFYGFRYCAVTATSDITIESIIAEPVSSSTEDIGSIETSHPMVNQLVSNILWGQRGNLISIPTDCPQRDERQGWTADTQVYSRTGMYNTNLETFYRKWMTDMRDGQRADGAFPDTAPIGYAGYGSSAWSDAGILVPWFTYLIYGNVDVLKENIEAMEKYMQWMAQQMGDGYQYNGALTTYGDWLSYASTDSRYISVAYYAYDAQIMASAYRVLSSRQNDYYDRRATQYDQLYESIKAEFRSRYVTPTIRQTSQTAYLLALEYNLLADEDEVQNFTTRLSRAVLTNRYRLSTGFVGTAIINTTLSRFGLTDLAYDLLLQRNNPSWLYPIDQGATTMWERWNSYTKESGFGDPGMNSFNHYAYGAVGEWMYRYMTGIEYDPEKPGFKHIVLQPQPDRRKTMPSGQERIASAKGSHHSYYGNISSGWTTVDDEHFSYECTIPANTTATLRMPVYSEWSVVMESGIAAEEAEGVEYAGYEKGCKIYHLGSGTYRFTTNGSTAVNLIRNENAPERTPTFDLSGRLLSTEKASGRKLSRGIYIADGKKFVVK
ncbi:MAG: family 78 glycoside hydrolase catalytic domain [Prevotella sp.]|nr:family 78 glycoside hydrolase catalytic domain [Prevotella sp.]